MPLSGIRVVDLTRILAGPFCSMMLADMGADIDQGRDAGRRRPAARQGAIRDGLSWYFAGFNRNKRSLTLNLRSDEGKAVLARLIEGSDVLVENYRPGVLARWASARRGCRNSSPTWSTPISAASARRGPYRDRPSFDFIAQAMSGFMA